MQVCLHGFKFGFLLEEAGTVSAKGKRVYQNRDLK